MKRPKLQKIKALPGYILRLTFIDGSEYDVRFQPFFDENQGLAPLKEPSVFASAVVDPWGGTVEWPEHDIQIGADTLWLDAQAQNAADNNTRVFAEWRARYGLSLKAAADALGMTTRTISAYGTSKRPVPKYIALACKGWEAEQRERNLHG